MSAQTCLVIKFLKSVRRREAVSYEIAGRANIIDKKWTETNETFKGLPTKIGKIIYSRWRM